MHMFIYTSHLITTQKDQASTNIWLITSNAKHVAVPLTIKIILAFQKPASAREKGSDYTKGVLTLVTYPSVILHLVYYIVSRLI